MSKVDWAQPLEAVHEDGRVVPVCKFENGNVWPDSGGQYHVAYGNDDLLGFFEEDGSRYKYGDYGVGWTIRNKPAAAVAPAVGGNEEWGPAIEVGGVRPAWLTSDTQRVFKHHAKYGEGWQELPVEAVYWETADVIRLPANHPHYRTENPAEAPLGVLTGVERLERLEALTARLAAIEVRSFHGDDLVGLVHEARGLIVDPDLLKAREVCNDVYADAVHPNFTLGRNDGDFPVRIALAGIKAGREMEK